MNLNMAELMKSMQQMQEKMQTSEQELKKVRLTGEAGAGLVKITLSGQYEIMALDLDDSLVGAEADKQILTDLLIAAFNDGIKKVQEATQNNMGSGLGDILPPGFKLPF